MKIYRLVLLFVLFSLINPTISAQTSPTESKTEKEKAQKELEKQVVKMLDQAIGDAGGLKLPANRAIVYALAGDLYWKFDEKRARELFRNAANDVVLANLETEKERKDSDVPFFQLNDFNDTRSQILPLVARHDADLALELLAQTRSAKLSEELAKAGQPNARQDGGMMNFNPEQFRVRQEIALEQRFAVLAAEQNPDKAIKLIKDSLAKGISWNVLPLLQKLNQKDEKKAAELSDEIVRKIVEIDLTKKRDDLNAAITLLQFAANSNVPPKSDTKQFKFSEAQTRNIAAKLANTFLQPINSLEITMSMARVMPNLEKLAPEKAVLLKQRQTEAMKNMPPEIRQMQQQQRIWNQNSTPEEILAELPKLNEANRMMGYNALARKIAQIEDEERAKKLIEQIPDQKARERAADEYQSAKISRTARDGKLEDAKKLIESLTNKRTQIRRLVALATEYHRKNGEKDRETAAALMRDAKNLANSYPEDEDELNDLMEIVRGYAVVNPDEAFRIFEPIVDQINDFVQASAILSKYNKRNRAFKKGELVMSVNGYSSDNLLLFRYINQIQLLGKADLNRTSLLADRFGRGDARTLVKLFVAQGFLRGEEKSESAGAGVVIVGN